MVSYLGTPPVATFEIEGSTVGKYIISGKGHHSPNTEYEICMYLTWKFSLNIPPISRYFAWWDTYTLPQHAAQNHSWNGGALREVSWFYVQFFYFDADIPLTCVRGCCKHSRYESSLLQWKQCLWCFTYMIKFSICPFSCIIYLKSISY